MNKCRFRITTPLAPHEIMEMPQADWFAGHAALLAALGIPDKNPVTSEAQALAIAQRAVDALSASAAQVAGKSGSSGKRFRRA